MQITNCKFPDWRLAAELGKIIFGLEFQAFAVVSTPLLLIPEYNQASGSVPEGGGGRLDISPPYLAKKQRDKGGATNVSVSPKSSEIRVGQPTSHISPRSSEIRVG
ncbi:MAG: hypothetical protein WCC59_18245, partial [Terriglobales bacterium]